MTRLRASPFYLQINDKLERLRTLKRECIRQQTPLSLEDARRVVASFVTDDGGARLHSAIGYVTPHEMLTGRQARDAKRDAAQVNRAEARRQQRIQVHSDARSVKPSTPSLVDYPGDIRPEDKALV